MMAGLYILSTFCFFGGSCKDLDSNNYRILNKGTSISCMQCQVTYGGSTLSWPLNNYQSQGIVNCTGGSESWVKVKTKIGGNGYLAISDYVIWNGRTSASESVFIAANETISAISRVYQATSNHEIDPPGLLNTNYGNSNSGDCMGYCPSPGGTTGGPDCEPEPGGGTDAGPLDPDNQPTIEPGCISPILIDLDGNGFHFGERGSGVRFDLLGNGQPITLQWTRPGGDDAFLVMDANGNGFVDDGSEMFGNGTRLLLENGKLAPNGFVGLAQYDRRELGGNDDGFITAMDGIWKDLYLWLDTDADGVSLASEMVQVAAFGLAEFETIPKESRHTDPAGNWLRFYAWARDDLDRTIEMVDVFFRVLDRGGDQN